MDVQDPKFTWARVTEAVNRTDPNGDPCTGGGADHLVADGGLGLAFEHVKGIDVVFMLMELDRESRPESGVDHLELREFGENAMVARTARGIRSPSSGGR
jgi:hypothetical protein